ncbi:hypothetical protein Cgig2_030337 [Carnegiea gigantea]|uniref:NADH:ubiquinone reductase (H(+)-translocating) n=1 Tax=Carnegiea gigantea TaxID=171969 RepID=A0A9Q1JL25_9CARY|nr:hypothetical protein Cgig2_030337 [Carnegiea gigantea]
MDPFFGFSLEIRNRWTFDRTLLTDGIHHHFSYFSGLAGISSIMDTGLNGAILQIISHGFIGAALFFLAGTSYDRIRLVYLDEMGGITIPMPNIFTFQWLFTGISCVTEHEWFHYRINSILWNNYQTKISFTGQNIYYFGNGNWNDINSYLLIIYVTSNVLWI